eukprot:gb/GECH01003982.1/.p1 GENE.gb/GECH01003982.1/~~gb/GECH01003982.1/.p1  ORF type:complete len:134 (+),score=8.15 gb/GECH01003982.1/:1-402(+)
MVKAAPHKKIVKKRTKNFIRRESHRWKRVPSSWRKPRGIDGPQRRNFRGHAPMPNIGYRSDKRTRYMDRKGFYRFPVRNVKELEVLLMQNRRFAAVIHHAVGARKRLAIVKRAQELDIHVVNHNARLIKRDLE